MTSANTSSGMAGAALFRGLTEQQLARLEAMAHRRRFAAGEVIVKEGQGGIAFFVLTAGQAVVTRTTSDGKQLEMNRITPGGAFGETALFTDRPRTATVTAVEPTECLALHRLEFLDELRRSPEVAIRLLGTLADRIAEAYELA